MLFLLRRLRIIRRRFKNRTDKPGATVDRGYDTNHRSRIATGDDLAYYAGMMTQAERNELAQLRELIARLAGAVVEVQADIAFLMAGRRHRKAPPGLMALKEAAAKSGVSYSAALRQIHTQRREIGGIRQGGRWYCDLDLLKTRLASHRAA